MFFNSNDSRKASFDDDFNLILDGPLSTASAKLHIVGTGSTDATFSLRSENSSNSPGLRVRDDGVVLMENLPTSSAGLPSGALWNNSNVINII